MVCLLGVLVHILFYARMFVKVMVLLDVLPCYTTYFVTCLTMWHNILEDSNLYIQHCESIKSHIIFIFNTVRTSKVIQIFVRYVFGSGRGLGMDCPHPWKPCCTCTCLDRICNMFVEKANMEVDL